MKTNLNQLIQSFNPFSQTNKDVRKAFNKLTQESNNVLPLFSLAKMQSAPSDSLQYNLYFNSNNLSDSNIQRMADRTQTLGYSNITSNNNNNRNNQQQRRDSGYFED